MITTSLRYIIRLTVFLLSPLISFAQYTPGDTYFGTNDYIEYHAGNTPIIISVPHGGYLEPSSIPDRECGVCVTGSDSRTEELAYDINRAIPNVFGGHPHIIINKLARVKLDANREIVEAALGNPEAETAWYEYQAFIQAAKDSCVANFGSAIFIDLHGHGHIIQRIELGYLISKSTLQLDNSTLDSNDTQYDCSIKHLSNELNPTISFAEILRGSECMGEFLVERGYPSVPSASDPAPLPEDPYFTGGYNTVRHGSRDSSVINSIQFELNWTGLRDTDANRKAFARALACSVRSFLDEWYFDLDSWDPGHVVSSTADSGPGSLRSVLLGAEDGTLITFDPALLGDTIRLEKELQICADVIIEGPGANLLALSGESTTRILSITRGSQVEVSGLSFVFGHAEVEADGGDGGAVLSDGNIRLVNCVLANNYAADDGGAIAVGNVDAIIELDSCLVSNNSCVDDGGGLRCFTGTLIINASTISSNYCLSAGGGLSMSDSVFISNSTFSGNEAASSGGGIFNSGEGVLIGVNTTFANNVSGNRGGAMNTSALADLNFCTIVGNEADDLGGGVRVPTGGTCILRNALIANNNGSSGNDVSMFSGAFISNGNNFVGDTTGSAWIPAPSDQLGNVIAPIDPLIFSLGSNGGFTETVALQEISPCIDQADATGAPLFDQRGEIRIAGSSPDIGAYEFCVSTTGIDIQTACMSYTWMDGNTYTSNNNTATFMLSNVAGCDSLVTLNLTITPVDISVTQIDYSYTANLAGATYQWLDCDDTFNIISGENNQIFTPISNSNYAVEITFNGCVDTSACSFSGIPDFDMDGFLETVDCDDTDPAINPNAQEIPNNGIDEDCDGVDLIVSATHEIGNSRINIYPNPVTAVLYISATESLSYEVKLFTIDGKLLIQQKNLKTIPVHDLEAGIYLLEIRDLNSAHSILERIIVAK